MHGGSYTGTFSCTQLLLVGRLVAVALGYWFQRLNNTFDTRLIIHSIIEFHLIGTYLRGRRQVQDHVQWRALVKQYTHTHALIPLSTNEVYEYIHLPLKNAIHSPSLPT